MERAFNIFKLASLVVLVVVVLLCISYTHAYGYSAAVGIGKPADTLVTDKPSNGVNSEIDHLGNDWDRDTYVANSDNSDSGLPPSTVPEPGTLILLGSGLLGLARYTRRRS